MGNTEEDRTWVIGGTGVFTWVWRVNGLLLLALGAVGLVVASFAAINVARFSSRDRPDQQLARVADADLIATNLRLGDFREVPGTGNLYAELTSPSEYIGSGSSGGLGRAHNLLFFDTVTKKAHWLLPDNTHTIPSFSLIVDPPGSRYLYAEEESPRRNRMTLAILAEVRLSSDGSPQDQPARTLAVASPDGRNLTTIAASIDGLLGFHFVDKSSVLVFYVAGGAARVLDLDPVARTVRADDLLSTRE